MAPEVVVFAQDEIFSKIPFSSFITTEFKELQRERHFKYSIYRQIDAKGIILLNYANFVADSAQPVSFSEYWHQIYGCNCQEAI